MSLFWRAHAAGARTAAGLLSSLAGSHAGLRAVLGSAERLAVWRDTSAADEPATGERFDLIVVESPVAGPEVRLLRQSLNPAGRVIVLDAEDPRHDVLKASLVDLGHVSVASGRTCWWGGPSGHPVLPASAPDAALPFVISFYTTGTPYEVEAGRLIESCRALGLDHHVVGVTPAGRWEANCALKAGVVLDAWRQLGRPVLWVDADAVIHARPTLLAGAASDFAVHKCDRWQFASGTIYFGATDAAGALLDRWHALCRAEPDIWDQMHLDRAWSEIAAAMPLETLWLPQGYTRIFDRPWDAGEEPIAVIEHFQASRRFKSIVSADTPRPTPAADPVHAATRAASRLSRARDEPSPRMDLFIAGMSRSGSTMLANLLTVGPSQLVLVEPGLTRGDMGEHVRRQCERLGVRIEADEWTAVPGETAFERFRRCIASRLAAAGVERWGVKEVNPAGWRDLFALTDPRRVIVIVRDLRDVAASFIEKQQRSPRAGQDEDWLFERIAGSARAQLDCTASLPADRLYVVRYEDFVSQPEARTALADWLGDWSLDGSPGEGLELFDRVYEAERHGQFVSTVSVARHLHEEDPRRRAFAARVHAALDDYQRRFGYV